MNIYILHMFLIPVVAIFSATFHLQLRSVPVALVFSAASCVLFSCPLCGRLIDGIRQHMNRLLPGAKFL